MASHVQDSVPDADELVVHLERTQAEQKARIEAEESVLADFRAVFSSSAGRRVLEFLRSGTIEKPTRGLGKPEWWGDFREGENNHQRRIEGLVRRAQQAKS